MVLKKIEFGKKNTYKVILIGNSGTGKSSLTLKYVHNMFNEKEQNTIGVAYQTKELINETTNEKIKMCIWDTAGQERFFSIVKLYFKHARGICCVYDVTNLQTLRDCEKWFNEVSEFIKEQDYNIPIILIGNKTDMLKFKPLNKAQKNIQRDLIEYYKKNYNIISHHYCSAKTGENIKEAMQSLIDNMTPNPYTQCDYVDINENISNYNCKCY